MKARKKSPEADRLRQVVAFNKKMRALSEEFRPLYARHRNNLLNNIESWAQQVIDGEMAATAGEVADARELLWRCQDLRQYERAGKTLDTQYEALHIGVICERMNSRGAIAIARLHSEDYVLDKDRPIKVSHQERRILDFIDGRTDASMGEFVPAVWLEPYIVDNRNKYDQGVHRFNKVMADESVPLRIGIDGLRVVISRH